MITKTIENTNEQEVEEEIEKSANERKAATEKIIETDPALEAIVTADDFLPIVEKFSENDATEIKTNGNAESTNKNENEPSENDYVVEDNEKNEMVVVTKDGESDFEVTKKIETTTNAPVNGKVDGVTIRTENGEKVRAKERSNIKSNFMTHKAHILREVNHVKANGIEKKTGKSDFHSAANKNAAKKHI